MEQHFTTLISLLEKLPHYRTTENLAELEHAATEYETILDQVHQANDYYKAKTSSYLKRVPGLEADLHQAKYGTSEKQREAAFRTAKQNLYAAIDNLATLVQHGPESAEE